MLKYVGRDQAGVIHHFVFMGALFCEWRVLWNPSLTQQAVNPIVLPASSTAFSDGLPM